MKRYSASYKSVSVAALMQALHVRTTFSKISYCPLQTTFSVKAATKVSPINALKDSPQTRLPTSGSLPASMQRHRRALSPRGCRHLQARVRTLRVTALQIYLCTPCSFPGVGNIERACYMHCNVRREQSTNQLYLHS